MDGPPSEFFIGDDVLITSGVFNSRPVVDFDAALT